ncbi:14 kDa proline-rich protein DC2.15 [Arachis duranensis]|uniref:14 kDa proline-rich protein DC2.15 n=1 Tax=Arachis duranensis TaxID=130453 RepID=A0A6P4DPQ7_ARADU|nr:14 kDa proline-rich protein DC2.15 [Arachis duranensis]
MAFNTMSKLSATILVLSLLSTPLLSNACGSCTPPPKPCPTPAPPPPPKEKCPKDTLKLGVCADVLGLGNVVVGSPVSSKCCALLDGLVDLEAALCLCTAIKANVLGNNLDVPVTLSWILSACQKSIPPGFQC